MAARISEKSKRPSKRPHEMVRVLVIAAAIIAAAFIMKTPAPKPQEDLRASLNPVMLPDNDAVIIPVPRALIPAGVKLKTDHFELVSYPRNQIPTGALTSIESLEEYEASVALPAQLPIFPQNVRERGSNRGNQVVDKIPQGMRAMTIKVDATSSVEGWASAGSLVDVLLVQDEKTTVVAEKVNILSAERSTESLQDDTAPSVPSTVTLLVTQEQCLAINTAIPLGRIAFALRSARDEDSWNDRTFTAANLSRGASSDREAAVSGFVVVKGAEGKERSYALSDGRWIVADAKPDGFMVSQRP